MPIVQFNVSDPVPDDAAVKSLLEEACSTYAKILECACQWGARDVYTA